MISSLVGIVQGYHNEYRVETKRKTTQKIDKISSENDKSDCKIHKTPTRNKVRTQTQNGPDSRRRNDA
jgi:hypothetical protein